MRVINAMFGQGRGGIEQALVDYSEALRLAGYDVIAFAHPNAAILPALQSLLVPTMTFANFGHWDIWAIHRLRGALQTLKPDVIIAHGNRAATLMRRAANGKIPVVGVAHNYNIKRFMPLDAVFCITQDMMRRAEALGIGQNRLFHIPNMVRVAENVTRPPRRNPPIIGSMGRFVTKKGFGVFIEALAILKSRGVPFQAVLGGAGDAATMLTALATHKGLDDSITFPGWVDDKNTFFDHIDIFCLPSHHEPFGIVLLEAMARRLPIVSTDSEGPSEILTHDKDGMLVPRADPNALSDALAALLEDQVRADRLAMRAFETVQSTYALPVVGKKLDMALRSLVRQA